MASSAMLFRMSKTGQTEPYLSDDTERLKTVKAESRLSDKQFKADMEFVMSSPSGRRVLWWLLEQAALGQDPMTGNSMTFYRLGEQSIGKKLHVAMWKASKLLYRLMQDENE